MGKYVTKYTTSHCPTLCVVINKSVLLKLPSYIVLYNYAIHVTQHAISATEVYRVGLLLLFLYSLCCGQHLEPLYTSVAVMLQTIMSVHSQVATIAALYPSMAKEHIDLISTSSSTCNNCHFMYEEM